MPRFKTAIIVAGGKGGRMNAAIPKQFIEVQGRPILMHTLAVFRQYDLEIKLLVVLPADQIEFWEALCKKHAFDLMHQLILGGQTRFESVKNALQTMQLPSWVAVHDGVRPLVSVETIARCFDAAQKHVAVIPVVDMVDSLRQITKNGNQSVDRTAFKLVQTPQVFDLETLKKAYEQDYSPLFTDDASVVESLGTTIHLVEGNRENIKITTQGDLKLADLLLANNK